MTPETENFDALRRLIKLKRYEQPPPGYFNDFSSQVIAQIKAGANSDKETLFDRLSWEVPWLRRLLDASQAKPVLAMGFGAAVCALLVGGVIYSESLEFSPVNPVSLLSESENAALVATPTVPAPGFGLKDPTAVAMAVGGTNGSLNPIIQPSVSLFDQFPTPPPELSKGRPLFGH
jgi:hypothetical protein